MEKPISASDAKKITANALVAKKKAERLKSIYEDIVKAAENGHYHVVFPANRLNYELSEMLRKDGYTVHCDKDYTGPHDRPEILGWIVKWD